MEILLVRPEEEDVFRWLDPYDYMDRLVLPHYFAVAGVLDRPDRYHEPAALMVACMEENRLVVEWLCVAPAFQGQGLAAQMFAYLFREARRLKKREVGVRLVNDDEVGPLAKKTYPFFKAYFPNEKKLSGQWKIDVGKFLNNPYLQKNRSKFPKAVKLRDVPFSLQRKAIRQLEVREEALYLYDIMVSPGQYDRDLSSLILDGEDACGLVLCQRVGDDCYPVFFYAESAREADALILCIADQGLEAMQGKGRVCVIGSDRKVAKILNHLYPDEKIETRLLTAKANAH